MMEHLAESVETMNDNNTAPSRLLEERVDEIGKVMGKANDNPLRIVRVGAGAWGSIFIAILQENYGRFRGKVSVRIWRRGGRAITKSTTENLFEVINSSEELIRRCAYLKYVEARLGDRVLYADKIFKDGFCLNMIETYIFNEISKYWKERVTPLVIISLAKGVEAV